MTEKEELEKAQAPTLQDLFEGVKGRRPKSLDELNEWLATDEGKEAKSAWRIFPARSTQGESPRML